MCAGRYDTGGMVGEVERSWELRLVQTTPAKLDLWRVIGDEADVAAYAAAHAPPATTTTTTAPAAGDWSAVYFQLSPENAVGTLGYRWDKGYALARLVRVSLPLAACGAEALVVDDTGRGAEVKGGEEIGAHGKSQGLMAASDVPGAFKSALLKSRLGIPPDEPLLPALGRRSPTPAVLVCRESAGEWEVAVPHGLLPAMARNAAWAEQRVAEFRPRAGVTAEMRPWGAEGTHRWHRWHDGDSVVTAGVQIQTGTQESPPAWLGTVLAHPAEVSGGYNNEFIPGFGTKPASPSNRPV